MEKNPGIEVKREARRRGKKRRKRVDCKMKYEREMGEGSDRGCYLEHAEYR